MDSYVNTLTIKYVPFYLSLLLGVMEIKDYFPPSDRVGWVV